MKNIYYVIKNEKGISRVRNGKHFRYFLSTGKEILNEKIIKRIKSLRIPPGYENVWICKKQNGHIQAYGFDDKGRKQYIYHPTWTANQEKNKFDHLIKFGKSLPKLRRKVKQHLLLNKLSKKKVIAAVIQLLDKTSIRIGSPQYDSYGLLTLRKKHLKIHGSTIVLDFEGKSKKTWHLELYNKHLADLLKRLEQKPGYKIFKYFTDDNKLHTLKVTEVNDYLQAYSGRHLTAKEFRTWKGSVIFLHYLLKMKSPTLEVTKKICIDKVAKVLGNTPNVCKRSYIHPLLMKISGNEAIEKLKNKKFKSDPYFSIDEKNLLYLLMNS